MPVWVGGWAAAGVVLARMLVLAVAHLRAALASGSAGPSDVAVSFRLIRLEPPGQAQSLVAVSIVNPGSRPVLVGLSVRRHQGPGWLGTRATTVRRTAARRYRAGRQTAIGIVPPGGTVVVPVLFDAARGRHRVVAVIGQSDHRLRVVSMPLAQPEDDTWAAMSVITGLFPRLAYRN